MAFDDGMGSGRNMGLPGDLCSIVAAKQRAGNQAAYVVGETIRHMQAHSNEYEPVTTADGEVTAVRRDALAKIKADAARSALDDCLLGNNEEILGKYRLMYEAGAQDAWERFSAEHTGSEPKAASSASRSSKTAAPVAAV